jgi:hypothetical protein
VWPNQGTVPEFGCGIENMKTLVSAVGVVAEMLSTSQIKYRFYHCTILFNNVTEDM